MIDLLGRKNYLLDTNIVSAFLKRNEIVTNKLWEVRNDNLSIFISCITYYEIKRGLLSNNATRKIDIFDNFCQKIALVIFSFDQQTIEQAARIYADLKLRGRPIQDADILIAATAITQNLILVSNDTDILRVQGVTRENWLDLS